MIYSARRQRGKGKHENAKVEDRRGKKWKKKRCHRKKRRLFDIVILRERIKHAEIRVLALVLLLHAPNLATPHGLQWLHRRHHTHSGVGWPSRSHRVHAHAHTHTHTKSLVSVLLLLLLLLLEATHASQGHWLMVHRGRHTHRGRSSRLEPAESRIG